MGEVDEKIKTKEKNTEALDKNNRKPKFVLKKERIIKQYFKIFVCFQALQLSSKRWVT